jgi:membrane protein DedA with SNARE-associated domain
MNFGLFSLVTIAGSALWCWILAYLGDKAYHLEPQLLTSPEALEHFIRQQSKGILLLIALFAGLYMLALRLMKPRAGA